MNSEDVREHILNSAGPVFADRGYRGATVREICAAAGVNVAAVNYHFGDKSQLYVATVTRAHQLRATEFPLPDWSADEPPAEKLRSFIATLVQRMAGQRGTTWPIRLMLREVLNPTQACRRLVEDYFRPQTQLLLSILDEMLPADVPRPRRQKIAFSIIGQCLFYRTTSEVLPMLLGKGHMREHFQTGQIADHIADFACAALTNIPRRWAPPVSIRK